LEKISSFYNSKAKSQIGVLDQDPIEERKRGDPDSPQRRRER
jgi:hypothetical protein